MEGLCKKDERSEKERQQGCGFSVSSDHTHYLLYIGFVSTNPGELRGAVAPSFAQLCHLPEASSEGSFNLPSDEGAGEWTADMRLSDRISHAELAREYIPDFTCNFVPLKDYNNSELIGHHSFNSSIIN